MASIAGVYNPDAEPSSGFTLLPDDTYTLEVVESDYSANSDGDGMTLALKTQVMEGEHEGRTYFIWMDLEHNDDKRQERGQRDFAALRRAVGVLAPEDTDELHFKPFQAKIGSYTSKKTGKVNNTIKEYIFDRGDGSPANDNTARPAPRPAAAASPAAKSKPWKK